MTDNTAFDPEEALLIEGAEWIAAQLEEDGIMIELPLVHRVLVNEIEIRQERNDPAMSHAMMLPLLLERLIAEGIASTMGGMDQILLREILFWEDEFWALAGMARDLRP